MNPPAITRLNAALFRQFCSSGPKFQTLTELFVFWLRQHFGCAETIENSQLRHLIWRPEIENTGIVIESATVWDPRITQHRPSVVVKRQGWKNVRVGIDNRFMGESDVSGTQHYANLWQGSHTFFCVTNDGGSAEILGTEVFRECNQAGRIVQHAAGLMRLEVMDAGELAKLKEAKEAFAVPITLGYIAEETWSLAKEAPVLQNIKTTINS